MKNSFFRYLVILVIYTLLSIKSSTRPKPRPNIFESRRNCTSRQRRCFPIVEPAKCPITIVTAYFDVPSKQPRDVYVQWMQNILSIKSCMVIFTNECHMFKQHASNHRIILHADLQKEIRVFNQSKQFWKMQIEMDPEKRAHKGYLLYWIWALKPTFVSKSAEYGFFNSDYYAWMDIGMFRDSKLNHVNIRTALPPPSFDPCCIHFGTPFPFEPSDLILNTDGSSIVSFSDQNRVCGCAFLLTKQLASVFQEIYFNTFNDYVSHGWFVGKDQTLMNTACVENTDLFRLIQPNLALGDRWWTLAYYIFGLMPDTAPVQLHTTTSYSEHLWMEAFTF